MTLPDLINGALEASGGLFIALSVIKLHREKVVRGVSAVHVGFFSTWGFWNLFYYPHLDQWLSFWGGFFLVAVNCVWLGQMLYYNSINKPPVLCWQNEIDDDATEMSLYDRGERTPQAIAQHHERMQADQFGGFDRTTPRYRHNDK